MARWKSLNTRGRIQVRMKHRGDWVNTHELLEGFSRLNFARKLEEYGKKGVEALEAATPKRTGKTASSWAYTVFNNEDTRTVQINWRNTNLDSVGRPIAVLIQYGHATKNGGWIEGRDYINPAIQPIFEAMANDIWEEVTSTRGKRRR